MRSFRRWQVASLAALVVSGLASPALAQETPETAATGDELETIFVTVNRREENMQDVAVSVATLQPDQVQSIFDAGADITALAARVPGLFVESSNGRVAPRFYIRGLGNTDFDLAASQPVSVIMDEVVLENVTLKSFPIFDVERIEVLRGPQGTLFGRNTPAGIVKIDTARPTNTFDAQGSLSVGSHGTVAFDGAVGGPIIEDRLAGRFSVLLQRRSDFIDNGFTGEDDAFGGYTDFAARAQLLFTATDRLSFLALAQYRNLDGESTLFRANILGPGDNELNANYDRDTVFYDAGGGNPADYEVWGASFRADYEFDGATLTSITAHYESEGRSRGDIDGGNPGGPGFIPFPSDTQDSIDLSQTTQEVRLASSGDGPFDWQVGGYYFDSDFDVLTEGFTFPPPVTVRHRNESWALFGQVSAEVTTGINLTAGLRYTEDDKDFEVVSGAAPNDRSVGDERLSWDLAAMADVTPEFRLYARVASGFRAPTIQGRDVAFFAPPSVATSEKIMSYEVGFKSELAGRRVRLNGAIFHYNVDDPQFTAVGGAGNLVQLVNAEEGQAWGFELEGAFRASENFVLTAGVSYNDTEINDDTLAVGICAQCTVLDPIVVLGGANRALVDGNPFPNAPDWIFDVTARWSTPVGNGGEIFVFTDWAYQGQTNFFHESAWEPFLEGVVAEALKLRLGDPLEAETSLGPMATANGAAELRGQVEAALAGGATAHVDPAAFADGTRGPQYVPPQLLTNVDHSMAVMREESFGPVVGLMKVRDDDEAIRLMNDSRYGLSASIWTSDLAEAEALAPQVEVGTVLVNRCDYLDPGLAWTGARDSGRGASLGRHGFEAVTRPRSLHVRKP